MKSRIFGTRECHKLTVSIPLKRKFLPQNSQVKGIAPVWIRWCSLSVPRSRNWRPHTSHWCGLAPVCTVWCFRNWSGVL